MSCISLLKEKTMITYTNMDSKETGVALAENPTTEFTYWNSHIGGYKDTRAFGLWISYNGRFTDFAMDCGEVPHALKAISWSDSRNMVVLSEHAIGDFYGIDGICDERTFAKSHLFSCYWVGRLRFDSQKELEDLLKLHSRGQLEQIDKVFEYIERVNQGLL